jgi:hypothetical protein
MAFNNPQNRNVPIHSAVNVPKEELVHIPISSKRISKKKIEELAIQKYRACGQGIDFSDVTFLVVVCFQQSAPIVFRDVFFDKVQLLVRCRMNNAFVLLMLCHYSING